MSVSPKPSEGTADHKQISPMPEPASAAPGQARRPAHLTGKVNFPCPQAANIHVHMDAGKRFFSAALDGPESSVDPFQSEVIPHEGIDKARGLPMTLGRKTAKVPRHR